MSRPKGKKVVGSRCIYKVKHAADRSVEKYKVRFMAKGFSQKEGIDYEEPFTLVANYSSIRTIISLASSRLASPSDGRQECLPQRSDRGGGVY